jgi:hypothetical protein
MLRQWIKKINKCSLRHFYKFDEKKARTPRWVIGFTSKLQVKKKLIELGQCTSIQCFLLMLTRLGQCTSIQCFLLMLTRLEQCTSIQCFFTNVNETGRMYQYSMFFTNGIAHLGIITTSVNKT